MKKQIIPYAVVATMTFGSATMTVQAIEPEQASENYPSVIEWSETDWNSYLEENYGTNLDDYDTVSELEEDIGAPLDLSALGNADTSDPNVLDIMERYNLSAEELVLFLDTYENVDNIYFLGDLENALEQEGYEQTDSGEGADEPATDEGQGQGTDEPATDQGQDEGTDEPATDEGQDQGTEEPATDEGSEYAFDMSQLEEVYLTPLGWTQDEFSAYVEDNYDMSLTDFESFDELENTVGPVLTDERLQDILDSYGLTTEEYRELLADYGETPEDYNFVYELEEAFDYYTSGEAENADTETGAEMPETATNSLLMTMVGLGAAAGGAFLLYRRRALGEK
ncbi:processed acidic surface protein [Planococcus halotolerans]|uniref:processed acidic surface protein n=1 Tax=Planococcus halotolerans TaxID=2233542 RepID=UPI0010930CF9|nr:processed acidic surface protein [Planococcus halotolerans]QHJ70074.1 processed acidic surface protein [Planococcus halotolerans]